MIKLKKYVACFLLASFFMGNIYPNQFSFAAIGGANAKKEGFLWDSALSTPSTASKSTPSTAMLQTRGNSIGDIWDSWSGKTSFEFLRGNQGKGSRERPFLIKNKEQLMGLSELAAMGMTVSVGTGTYAGDYSGAYFALAANIDMQGVDWIPIGFYRDSSEIGGAVPYVFEGNFDGQGHEIKNLKLNSFADYDCVGLFGSIANAQIKNLTIETDSSYLVKGADKTGILVGEAVNSRIEQVTVKNGYVDAAGAAGGLAGSITDTTVENVICENVKVDSSSHSARVYVGGIAGQATSSLIVDCLVTTGNNISACIKGKGYVGGITGSQNGTDLYNTYVSGTIGGEGSLAIGGITGEYVAGKMKVARFEGTIANSYLGANSREGSFIGTRKGAATNFNYIEDVGYLFADSYQKIGANVCGSGISDDNDYTYKAKIGYSHPGDPYYTLVQGGNTRAQENQYFYEVLEEGILSIMDQESLGDVKIDHFAPNATGKPVRGYLVTAEQIDTMANGRYYYDVAGLTVSGSSQYSKPIDKNHRGALAYGDLVSVTTAPNHTDTEKYEMDKTPFYKNAAGEKKQMTWDNTRKGYTFLMPSEDIAVSAIYKKVAVSIQVHPSAYRFQVIQTRTGNRKNPTKTTVVKNQQGQLIATYIDGTLSQETQVQPVNISATIDTNNDVSDGKIRWSIDDSDLMILKKNSDQDQDGYTNQSATIGLNMNARFFADINSKLERQQADSNYIEKIPNTIYGDGHQNGGVAILTGNTRPAASFEGKPCTDHCRINVTYQIIDQTYVAIEDLVLDKQSLEFVVTRTLKGDRKRPVETITFTAPQVLTPMFRPDFYSSKDITWNLSDESLISIKQDQTAPEKDALLYVREDAKWIRDLIAIDNVIKANDPYAQLSGWGEKKAVVRVTAEDKLGNRKNGTCQITIKFQTIDKTEIQKSSGGGGSSGGSSSSGRSGSNAVTPGGTTKGESAPTGAVTGIWVQDATGQWLFTGSGRTFTNEWAYIHNPFGSGTEAASWFRFDQNGHMMTGWFTDVDGSRYFLHNLSDGTLGRMYLGWNWIKGQDGSETCYYFNAGDGIKGRLYQNTDTPDGYRVNAQGAWAVDGVTQKRLGV